jgi:hypothetical protein
VLASMPRGAASAIVPSVSPFLLAAIVVFFLMLMRLTDVYGGGEYVCPTCGARSKGRHSPDCPWNDPSSG